jgi:predicted neutral ceramidase superfamily lipid hydrolase
MEKQINSVYLSFLKRLLIFSLIPGSIAAVLYFSLPAKFITPVLPFLFLFFIAVTLINAYILLRSSQKKFIKYLNAYLLTTVLKLFLFTGVIIIYVLFNKADLIPFTLSFFILYLCYTIFEVVCLVSFSKTSQS